MMNRTKKEDKVKEGIIDLISKSAKPMSTQEIAEKLGKPWHSIQTRCLMLQIEGKINGFRVGRTNIWENKKSIGDKEK
jgi:repressor of nif and glnA expression